jgi:hypothetical protein
MEFVSNVSEIVSVSIIRVLRHDCFGNKKVKAIPVTGRGGL